MRALRASAGIGLVVGALLVLGPAMASAAVLYSQLDNRATGGAAIDSNDYSNDDTHDDQAADDFTVPAGQSWQLTQVVVDGPPFVGSPPANVNVFVYTNAGGLPGTEIFRNLNLPATSGPSYVIPLTSATPLTPGTYWVSVQQAGATDPTDSWAWSSRSVQTGNHAAIRSPGGMIGTCGTGWASTTCTSSLNPDLMFRVDGIASPYTPPSTAPTNPSNKFDFGGVKLNKDKGTATLSVQVPGPGTLSLSGKGIVGQRPARLAHTVAEKKVTKAGTVKLTVKAKGNAKRKLNGTGKAKVKAKVTFTPAGGTAKTERKRITLKKTL
jgi:hypothetical protein